LACTNAFGSQRKHAQEFSSAVHGRVDGRANAVVSRKLGQDSMRTVRCRAAKLLCALALFSFSAWPQVPKPTPTPKASSGPTVPAQPAPGTTASHVDAFLDGMVPMQLEREDVAGAVIVIVKDGNIFFSKGYGYAD